MSSSSFPPPDPEQGLILTHGILLTIVTLLVGPALALSFYVGGKSKWNFCWNTWFSLMGNMITGVVMGIVVAVRKDMKFTHPHFIIGIILFALALLVSTTPFIPERYIRNDLRSSGISVNQVLFPVAVVVWIVAIAHGGLGIHYAGGDHTFYIVYGVCTGVSCVGVLAVVFWLARKASIRRRQENSRARDLVAS